VSPRRDSIRDMRRRGMKLREIANTFGISISAVYNALDDRTRAVNADRSFTTSGDQPVEHRETEVSASGAHLELDSVYRPIRLGIHECSDLLREWGVR